jgi:AAHS family benzoate transporter-like MFS transporter
MVPLMLWLLPESLVFLVAKRRVQAAQELAGRLGVAVPAAPIPGGEKVGWKAVLREIFDPRSAFATACFWIALFMGLLLVYGLAQWLPQIMRKSGYNLGDSLLFLAVFSVAQMIGGVLLGRLADRFGNRRAVAWAYVLAAIAIAALVFKSSIGITYTLVALAGFGIASTVILTAYVGSYFNPLVRAASVGWALSFARIGALTGPLAGGYVASLGVAPEWNFYMFALVAAVAAAATALVPEKRSFQG